MTWADMESLVERLAGWNKEETCAATDSAVGRLGHSPYPAGTLSDYRRVLRPLSSGALLEINDVLRATSGFYKGGDTSIYLWSEDKKTKVGEQITDPDTVSHASFYMKSQSVIIHGNGKEAMLSRLGPLTDVNGVPPERRKQKNKGTPQGNRQQEAPPGPGDVL